MRNERIEKQTILDTLDAATAALVRLSARITAGNEESVRAGLAACAAVPTPARWIEELVLQSYLFAGFPRALNAAREWRRTIAQTGTAGAKREQEGDGERGGPSPSLPPENPVPPLAPAPIPGSESYADLYNWRIRGEETCATVYGGMYEKLRGNIRQLHPQLDEWMIVEGYGKVLSRQGLDLPRRELCIVAACVAAQQDRQLHSHLHGALNAGASRKAVDATLVAIREVVPEGALVTATFLWNRVKGK